MLHDEFSRFPIMKHWLYGPICQVYIWPAIIAGGSLLGAAAIGKGGGGGGIQTIPQTEEAKKARKKIFALAEGEPPDIPLRKIAPLQPMTEERQLARETAKGALVPTEQGDFLSLPEVQGIILEATQKGNLLANRLGRMLQTSGSLTSTPGRDVLGRVVTDVQKNIASSLAPFASEQRGRAFAERGRIQNLIPVLEGLGLTEELRKRGFTQEQLDALFSQEYETSKQLETFTIPLLQSIIGQQPGAMVMPQKPSAISELGPLIGPLLAAVLMGGGGGGGNTTGWNPAGTTGNMGVASGYGGGYRMN